MQQETIVSCRIALQHWQWQAKAVAHQSNGIRFCKKKKEAFVT